MNRIVLYLLLGSVTIAVAQAPPDGEQAADVETGERALPCVPAGEAGPLDGDQQAVEPGSIPCEEQDPAEASDEPPNAPEAPVEIAAESEAVIEEDPDFEATAEEEFTPDDEISEDYPVPLPSDI